MIAAMGRLRGAVLAGTAAVLLAASAPAQAVTLVPPGKAGADQYFEVVPSAGGNAAPPPGAPSALSSGALAPYGHGRAGANALARLGSTGKAAAALAAATAPKPAASGTRAGASGGGSSPLSAIGKALDTATSGGLGLVLPLALATAFVLALAVAGRKLLSRQGPPELGA